LNLVRILDETGHIGAQAEPTVAEPIGQRGLQMGTVNHGDVRTVALGDQVHRRLHQPAPVPVAEGDSLHGQRPRFDS